MSVKQGGDARDEARLQALLERLETGEPYDALVAELDDAPELRALFALAARTAEVLPREAPGAMRARQREVLQDRFAALTAAARPAGTEGPPPASPGRRAGRTWTWGRLLLGGAALAAVLLLLTGTSVVASAESLPGDALYSVKRGAETVRLAVTVRPEARARLRLAFASERLDEIRALVDRGLMPAPEVVESLLASLEAAVAQARSLDDPALLGEVEARQARIETELDRLADRLPDGGGDAAPQPPRAGSETPGEPRDGADDAGFEPGVGAAAEEPADARATSTPRATGPAGAASPTRRVDATEARPPSATPAAPTPTAVVAVPTASGGQGGGAGTPPTSAPPVPTQAPPPTSAPPEPTAAPPDPAATERATQTTRERPTPEPRPTHDRPRPRPSDEPRRPGNPRPPGGGRERPPATERAQGTPASRSPEATPEGP